MNIILLFVLTLTILRRFQMLELSPNGIIFKKNHAYINLEPLASFIEVHGSKSEINCAFKCTRLNSACGFFFGRYDSRCLCRTTMYAPKLHLMRSIGYISYIQDTCEVDGYVSLHDNDCVKVHKANITYGDAHAYCRHEEGRLIKIDSHSKYDAISKHLSNIYGFSKAVLSIDGSLSSGAWRFSDNSQIPDEAIVWGSSDIIRGQRNCLSIYNANLTLSDFRHGISICSAFDGFICERV